MLKGHARMTTREHDHLGLGSSYGVGHQCCLLDHRFGLS